MWQLLKSTAHVIFCLDLFILAAAALLPFLLTHLSFPPSPLLASVGTDSTRCCCGGISSVRPKNANTHNIPAHTQMHVFSQPPGALPALRVVVFGTWPLSPQRNTHMHTQTTCTRPLPDSYFGRHLLLSKEALPLSPLLPLPPAFTLSLFIPALGSFLVSFYIFFHSSTHR